MNYHNDDIPPGASEERLALILRSKGESYRKLILVFLLFFFWSRTWNHKSISTWFRPKKKQILWTSTYRVLDLDLKLALDHDPLLRCVFFSLSEKVS